MTNPNDPAFSVTEVPAENKYEGVLGKPGLTKREYFAAMAMQGLRASKLLRFEDPRTMWPSREIAKQAVVDADALIAELNR